jgi:glycosyltransferase involved in cell wall biosynthesis
MRAAVERDAILRRVVRLAGFQPRSGVAALRQASSVSLCLMGGYSLIEACAASSPVVSYDVEWHHELVKDGETGFLVPEHDLAQLAEAVSRLLDDAPLGKSLGQRAREAALSRHGSKNTVAIKRRCYQEILNASQSAQSQ